jgi:hypothetical protein
MLASSTIQPFHRPAGHVERAGARLCQQRLLLSGIDADQQVIPVDSDGHVPVEQDRQAAEHLLSQSGLVAEDVQQPGGQSFVVRHAGIVAQERDWRPERQGSPGGLPGGHAECPHMRSTATILHGP